MDLVSLAIFSIATTYLPGPNPLMAMSQASRYGFKNTIPFLMGIFPGFFIMLFLCVSSSSALHFLLPHIGFPLRWIGGGYMMYLAWHTWRQKTVKLVDTKGYTMKDGFVLQFINIKTLIYGLTGTTYVMEHLADGRNILIVTFLLAIIPMSSYIMWALMGSVFKKYFNPQGKIFRVLLTVLMVYCAYKMVAV